VIDGLAEAKRPLAEASAIDLSIECPARLPAVWADRHRLLQVLENLVGNAIKFTPPGGRVTLRAEARGDEVWFRIADTGPGVAPDDISRLFDRFWQSHEAKHHGSGLGLAI